MVYFPEIVVNKLVDMFIHEMHNSLLYEKISHELGIMGLDNLSKYYQDWSCEEKQHSSWVKEFLNSFDLSLKYDSIEVEDVDLSKDCTVFVDMTLETENQTTKLWQEVLEMSHSEMLGSGMLKEFALKLLEEQTEETRKTLGIYSKVKNIGNNKTMLQLFDATFES